MSVSREEGEVIRIVGAPKENGRQEVTLSRLNCTPQNSQLKS